MTASRIVRRPIFITNTQKEITKTNKKEDEGNRNILYKRRKKKRKKKEKRKEKSLNSRESQKSKNRKKRKKSRNQENRAFVTHLYGRDQFICDWSSCFYARECGEECCVVWTAKCTREPWIFLYMCRFSSILSQPLPFFYDPAKKQKLLPSYTLSCKSA